MKLSEVIAILKQIEEEHGGDLPVYIWPTTSVAISYRYGCVEFCRAD